MNNWSRTTSNRPMTTRRRFLGFVGTGAAVLMVTASRVARAQTADSLVVKAGSNNLAALVAAVLGSAGQVSVDPKLAATDIKIGAASPTNVTDRILFKGQGDARGRFLDDARNAPRVAMNIQHALAAARPDLEGVLDANERAWAKPFAKQAFKWGRRLGASPVAGKNVKDRDGRVYLLEWAGATVSPRGNPPPRALAGAPKDAKAPTPAAYEAYVEALVGALT